MKNDKEKAPYESPQTEKTQVILESGICASSVDIKNPETSNGQIEEHQVNTGFDYHFTDQGWDEIN